MRIDTTTAQAQLIAEYSGEIEDISWNEVGDLLYGVENIHDDPVDSHGGQDFEQGIRLLSYDGQQVQTVCTPLTATIEIEALETLPGDLLLFGYHGAKQLQIGTFNPTTCEIVMQQEIATVYRDVEGLAWPNQCSLPN